MAELNRLAAKSTQPLARNVPSAAKPLHNEIWSVRSLAQQHFSAVAKSETPLVLEAGEARLLLGTLISLIDGKQPRIEEAKSAVQAGMLKAAKMVSDKLAPPAEE